jgi:hypothetical protein
VRLGEARWHRLIGRLPCGSEPGEELSDDRAYDGSGHLRGVLRDTHLLEYVLDSLLDDPTDGYTDSNANDLVHSNLSVCF